MQNKDMCIANFQAAAQWRVAIVGKSGGLQSSTKMRALLILSSCNVKCYAAEQHKHA